VGRGRKYTLTTGSGQRGEAGFPAAGRRRDGRGRGQLSKEGRGLRMDQAGCRGQYHFESESSYFKTSLSRMLTMSVPGSLPL